MNLNFKATLEALLQTLGFVDKVRNNEMKDEDWITLDEAYKKDHGVSLKEAIEETKNGSQDPLLPKETQDKIMEMVTKAKETAGIDTSELDTSSMTSMFSGLFGVFEKMNSEMANMKTEIEKLSSEPESGNPVGFVQPKQNMEMLTKALGQAPHTTGYLFGIEENYYRRGTWWNEIVVTGKPREDNYRSSDSTEFLMEFNKFAADFKDLCRYRVENNQLGLLDFNKMIQGEAIMDYSPMFDKFGEYSVRRMDRIIAYLRTLKSVAPIFPQVSIQNETTAPTAHFGELSQAFLEGHYFKGSVHFDGEKYRVSDVMMKFPFKNPKELERQYIGYMNREGSNPMKWTLFEWIIVRFGTVLFNEQQRRRVIGVATPRQDNFAQPAMLAADGVLRAIQRVEEENKVLPFFTYKVYNENTILDYIRSFWSEVVAILPNVEGMKLYVNEKHRLWFIEAYDKKYGRNTDYTGPKNDIRYFSPESIVWVPNMDMVDYKMWITTPGNIENYQLKALEMYAFYFQQDLETLIMASWWKEGSGVLAPGVQFKTRQDLINSKRKLQFLFTNFPVTDLEADASTIDASKNIEFQTSGNTVATSITDIQNFSVERVYKIHCGDLNNATTIKKAGIFSEIDSDWEPKAVGDYIKVHAQLHEVSKTVSGKTYKVVEPTGKFLELERRVTV